MKLAIRIAAVLCLGTAAFGQSRLDTPNAYSKTVTQNGTNVTVTVDHVDRTKTAADPLREFENVIIRLHLKDVATGSPLPGALPAAWIDRHHTSGIASQEQCVGEVKRFAEGSTFSHTEVDLTSFYVVLLNADATLTVVDPRFGYGDTRLLAMVQLDGPGEDWALTETGDRLFVSVPATGKVVSVDTDSWKIVGTAALIPQAARIVLQPDEAYLWVAYGRNGESSGVAAVDAHDMKVVARIPTGHGYHHIAISADSSLAFVTNPDDGTVTVIDIRKLSKLGDVAVGSKPRWITYSDLAKTAYVANEGDGKIVAIDGATRQIRATVQATTGLGQIRFAPGGRFALAVNPTDDFIYIVDAASNRIVQQGKLDKGPDEISFTNKQAHIRHRGSDAVLMITLASLGRPDEDISVADFSGGRHSPGKMSIPTPADGIVQASGENAVLVANPGDASVYLYMEGAAAPMGNFSNYGHEPRAVLSIDRNLRERVPGVYETTATLPVEGSYDLALFLDRPHIISCFDLPVAPDPRLARVRPPRMKIEPRIAPSALAGQPAHLAFRLTFAETGEPDPYVKDVVILMMGPTWQRRDVASYHGDGVYSVDFAVPTPGTYNVILGSSSLGLSYSRYSTVEIQERTN